RRFHERPTFLRFDQSAWWRTQSGSNGSPPSDSLFRRESTGKFRESSRFGAGWSANIRVISKVWENIPARTNREILLVEQ
ncbi:hypothetical protein, partial [Rhodoplanes sp.]|uniref:hypothetical protein n=1 Tax=Rhodoplanes sp. TaxID=1968906 RepID=UPI0025D5744C